MGYIGAGSVFEVSRVRDAQGRMLVAKRPRPGLPGDLGRLALARERDILRVAASPPDCTNLPACIADGEDDQGPYLVETIAPGESVREKLDQAHPLPVAAWLALARGASRALADLHALADDRGPLGRPRRHFPGQPVC